MKPLDRLTDDELIQHLRRALKELPDAPPALQQAAIDLWPAASPRQGTLGAAATAMLHRIAAALTFDSWAAPAFAPGMRSLRSPTRHLLYSAQGRDIDLRISPGPEGFGLAGQVLGPDDSGAVELAELGPAPGQPRRAPLDALGEFRIDSVPQGTFILTLLVGKDQIVLPPVEVGDCKP
jgi:hypothetical protein